MLKVAAALATAAASILMCLSPAFAGETSPIMIADIGHDSIGMRASNSTNARIVWSSGAQYPTIDEDMGNGGTAVISVRISAGGKVEKTSVFKTSGNSRLDRSAATAVADAQYRAATLDGNPVGGTYNVLVEFDPKN